MKVLILSYFFPPSNFVGGERTYAWSKYLSNDDIYPIIITRQWNDNQMDITSKVFNNQLEIEKTNKAEIHRLPYRQSLRDKLSLFPKLFIAQKALTFFELVFSNFYIGFLPYSNFYKHATKVLEKNPDIEAVIASGRPFQSFFIGYLLKKKFPHIHWIPDYRDEWNSHQQSNPSNFLSKFIKVLETKSERKWTSNSTFFLSVSDYWVSSISKFINKEGITIKNGFEKTTYSYTQKTNPNKLVISYIGSLYEYQEIDTTIDAVKSLIRNNQYDIHFFFIGLNMMEDQEKRVSYLTRGYENNFTILPRMKKNELIEYYEKSDLLLVTAFKGVKGWYPVKLFEYYQTATPILLCPSDKGDMENFVLSTNCGYVADTKDGCIGLLNELFTRKRNGLAINTDKKQEVGEQFSRQYQTQLLAKTLLALK